jgi:hypothetical protein
MDDDDGYVPRSTRRDLLVAEYTLFGKELLVAERILANQLEALAGLANAKTKAQSDEVAEAVSQTVCRLLAMLPGGPLQ